MTNSECKTSAGTSSTSRVEVEKENPIALPSDLPGEEESSNLSSTSDANPISLCSKPKRPSEYVNGEWEVEPYYYYSYSASNMPRNGASSMGAGLGMCTGDEGNGSTPQQRSDRRNKRGMIYKSREDCEYKCFQDSEGSIYRLGDHVFIETQHAAEPYLIGCILMFKMTKRSDLLVKVSRYYRPDDVPEVSYSLIVQERKDLGQQINRQLRSRELFSSEACVLHPISSLRGKCRVKLVKDIRSICTTSPIATLSTATSIDLSSPSTSAAGDGAAASTAPPPTPAISVESIAEEELLKEGSFFTCLNFNQDSSRLASVQGEIRVGGSFQAKLPPCATSSISDEPDRDELLYRPDYVCAETEQNYVKLARTFRTFSLMNNKKITMLEKAARSGDLLYDDAVVTLHRCGYNVVEATKMMQANDQHLTSDSSFMSAEDVKKFGKGIKTYGKNFSRISKELIPLHQRDQLVGFYYLWKKSRDATRPKPLRKNAVVAVGRRGAKPNNGLNGVSIPRNASSKTVLAALSTADMELLDYASASETETEQLEEQQRACHHCYSSKSRDWHHAGKERQLMCTECRIFYKKYGQLRPVDRPATVPPCLMKSARQSPTDGMEEQENDEPTGVRTRGAGRKERRRTPSSLEPYGLEMGRTPIKAELFENGSNNGLERRTTPQRNAKANRKRTHRGSNSGLEEFSPLTKSKRARNTESRTPSPPTTQPTSKTSPTTAADQKPSAEHKSTSSSSNQSSSESSPTNVAVKKEEPISSLNNNDYAHGLSNGVTASSESTSTSIKSGGGGGKDSSSLKKPIAKVEPLDPNESSTTNSSGFGMGAGGVQRKSGVVGTATKLVAPSKREPASSESVPHVDGQKPSTSTSPEVKLLSGNNSDQEDEEQEDASAIGEVADLDVRIRATHMDMLPQKKGGLEVYPNLRRVWKRSSGITCGRTDIVYVDGPTSKWSQGRAKKKAQDEQKELEAKQKQQEAEAAAAAAQFNHAAQAGPHGLSACHLPQQMMAGGRKPSDLVGSPEFNAQALEQMNQALAMGHRVPPLNGTPAGAGVHPGAAFPPPAMAAAAALHGMDPRMMAAAINNQQLHLMMMGQLEQQQKMEQMQRQQQQQQQQQAAQQRQQLNGSISGGTPNSHHAMVGPGQQGQQGQQQQQQKAMLPQTPMTPHMASPMDQQRNAAISFMNQFNQQQQQAIIDAQQQQQQQQQQQAMGNPFGLPNTSMAGELAASQALQAMMMGDRAAAMEQQQRNSIIERLQMEYMNQQQHQQQQQQNQAAAALAAAASNAQQQHQHQQLMIAAAAGHPIASGLIAGADPAQVQMFLGLLHQQQQQQAQQQAQQQQQQQLALQQQQQQQQQAAAAAAQAAQQRAAQEQAAAAAAQQQAQQQQQQALAQQQFITAMNNMPQGLQQQMTQIMQQQQLGEFMRQYAQQATQQGGARNA